MWGALVEAKAEFIGGTLTEYDSDCGTSMTTIKDISLKPYSDTAIFEVDGDGWGCSINVEYGGLSAKDGRLYIHSYGGQTWTLERPKAIPNPHENSKL